MNSFTPLELVLMTTIASAVIPMAIFIRYMVKSIFKTTEKVTEAMVNNTHALNNNTRVVDKVFDKLDRLPKTK